MNPWALVAIAIVAEVVVIYLVVQVDHWRFNRRRELGLRQIYQEAGAEVDENAGVDRLRDRRPW